MKLQVVLPLVGLIGLSACSPYRVVRSQTYLPLETAQAFKTYNFVPNDPIDAFPTSVTSQQIKSIQEAIARQLEARGFRRAESPDLLVNVGLTVAEQVQTRETNIRDAPRYIGQRRYSWRSEAIETNRYDEGTLSVDVVDARQQKLFWEGAVSSVLTKRSVRPEAIEEAVEKLFGKFPMRVPAQPTTR